MEIVKLPVEDWRQYRALRLRALKEDAQAFSSSYADALDLPDEPWKARLRDTLQGEKSWLFFARDGGKLVGMIGAFVEDGTPHVATIVSVYVPVEERRKGISTLLLECILNELSQHPALRTAELSVNETQAAAIALYKKFGFRHVRTEQGVTGSGDPVPEMVMERPLPY